MMILTENILKEECAVRDTGRNIYVYKGESLEQARHAMREYALKMKLLNSESIAKVSDDEISMSYFDVFGVHEYKILIVKIQRKLIE